MDSTKQKKSKKKWIIIGVAILFIAIISSSGTDENVTTTTTETNTVTATAQESEQKNVKLSFTITAGEAGDYGKLISYNKGTEFEENFYAYYVPVGTYTVTNIGKYTSQINVYSDEKIINDAGWEEVKSIGVVKLLDVNASETIVVEIGQHIEIAEPSVFKLTQQ